MRARTILLLLVFVSTVSYAQEYSYNSFIEQVKQNHPISKQAKIGADGIGLDWQTNLNKARNEVNDQITLQGNLDPSILLSEPKVIEASVKKVLDDYGIGEGHIFNLGHGILPETNPEMVECLVGTVKNY